MVDRKKTKSKTSLTLIMMSGQVTEEVYLQPRQTMQKTERQTQLFPALKTTWIAEDVISEKRNLKSRRRN